jgi:hypothetical protein
MKVVMHGLAPYLLLQIGVKKSCLNVELNSEQAHDSNNSKENTQGHEFGSGSPGLIIVYAHLLTTAEGANPGFEFVWLGLNYPLYTDSLLVIRNKSQVVGVSIKYMDPQLFYLCLFPLYVPLIGYIVK